MSELNPHMNEYLAINGDMLSAEDRYRLLYETPDFTLQWNEVHNATGAPSTKPDRNLDELTREIRELRDEVADLRARLVHEKGAKDELHQ